MRKVFKLLAAIVVCQLAGVVGAIFTTPAIPGWYANLNKPSFNPPNWLFGPVWTLLYLLMGISLFLVWQGKNQAVKKLALLVFIGQLVANSLWSIIFFGAQQPLAALLVLVLLWFLIVLTIIKFFPLSKAAAYLLVPYLLWVSFAGVLNFFILKLN